MLHTHHPSCLTSGTSLNATNGEFAAFLGIWRHLEAIWIQEYLEYLDSPHKICLHKLQMTYPAAQNNVWGQWRGIIFRLPATEGCARRTLVGLQQAPEWLGNVEE